MPMITLTRPLALCTWYKTFPGLLSAAKRAMSGSTVVDQMLGYVWTDLKGEGQQAVDVLRSGLQMQPDPNAGCDSARLNLALAEAYAAENNWAEAASYGSIAAAAAAQTTPGLSALASFEASRALVASGNDAEAVKWSSPAKGNTEDGDLASLAQQLMVLHATSMSPIHDAKTATAHQDALAAGWQRLQDALQQQQRPADNSSSSSSSDRVQAVLLALAHKVAGDIALATSQLEAASNSYNAAKQALGSGSSCSGDGSNTAVGLPADPSSGLSSRLQHEVAADVVLGNAQVLMAQKQWDASEEALSAALAAAEAAAGTDKSPLVAPVLLLLGYGYARSARVMFAEGILREAAKLMLGGTEPARLVEQCKSSKTSRSHQAAHPSLKAALCWRYCQLLTALPNRTTEAATWGTAARMFWDAGSGGLEVGQSSRRLGNHSLEEVLGDDVALTGKGQHGHGQGAVASLLLRRMLPMLRL